VEALRFTDDSFDTVIATCVFCSVNDSVRGLREVRRVVRLGGPVLDNVREAGLEVVRVRRAGIWRKIEARPKASPAE
jgi:ubiquinone/menaquinone biosynthesis C-methylase UbiE